MDEALNLRAPAAHDVDALYALAVACQVAKYGWADVTRDEVTGAWQRPGFDLARDAWVVEAPGAGIVGYAAAWDDGQNHVQVSARVHPGYCGRGMGARLLRLAEARARETHRAGMTLVTVCDGVNPRAQRLLQREGYVRTQHDLYMEIEFDAPPPQPRWPAGVSVRAAVPGRDDEALHALDDEAFRGHAGWYPMTTAAWCAHMGMGAPGFDPALWYVAQSQGAIVGEALCSDSPLTGWLAELGVRPSWRRRGLGLALLRHAFAEFYRRGRRKASLRVNADNATGALELYRSAGMRASWPFDFYEKELR